MKRAFLFALVGVIALAFASCGEKQSKQFTEMKAAVEDLTNQVAEITSCDNMQGVMESVVELMGKQYDEADRMNEKEEGLMKTACEKLQTAIEEKIASLGGCKEEPETAAVEEVQLDENGNPILDAAEAAIEQAGDAVQEGVQTVVNEATEAIQG